MANIKSAKKRIRVIDKKTARNRRVKGHLKAILKAYDAALEAGDMETAKEKLTLAEKKLMQAAAKHTIHKNAASRKVSRLAKRFNKGNHLQARCFQKSFQTDQKIQRCKSSKISLTRPHPCIS